MVGNFVRAVAVPPLVGGVGVTGFVETCCRSGRTTPNLLEEDGWLIDLLHGSEFKEPEPGVVAGVPGPPEARQPCRTDRAGGQHEGRHRPPHRSLTRDQWFDDEQIEAISREARRRGYDIDAEDERDPIEEHVVCDRPDLGQPDYDGGWNYMVGWHVALRAEPPEGSRRSPRGRSSRRLPRPLRRLTAPATTLPVVALRGTRRRLDLDHRQSPRRSVSRAGRESRPQ